MEKDDKWPVASLDVMQSLGADLRVAVTKFA
jgi:hypothetical protein